MLTHEYVSLTLKTKFRLTSHKQVQGVLCHHLKINFVAWATSSPFPHTHHLLIIAFAVTCLQRKQIKKKNAYTTAFNNTRWNVFFCPFSPVLLFKGRKPVVKWNEEGHWSKVNLGVNVVPTTYCNSLVLGKYLASLNFYFSVNKLGLTIFTFARLLWSSMFMQVKCPWNTGTL